MCDKLYLYKDKNGLDWLDVAGCELLLYLFLKTICQYSDTLRACSAVWPCYNTSACWVSARHFSPIYVYPFLL